MIRVVSRLESGPWIALTTNALLVIGPSIALVAGR